LAVIIGNRLSAPPKRVLPAVAGVTCLNDVTARDIQRAERAVDAGRKGSTPSAGRALGHRRPGLVEPARAVPRERRGEAGRRTKDQVFPVPRLLAFISAGMTLEAGDVVTTGTPAGVGPIRAGDVVEVEVEGVGVFAQRGPRRVNPSVSGRQARPGS